MSIFVLFNIHNIAKNDFGGRGCAVECVLLEHCLTSVWYTDCSLRRNGYDGEPVGPWWAHCED